MNVLADLLAGKILRETPSRQAFKPTC